MNQARISNLISKLNYNIQPKARNLKNSNGPEGRVLKLQKTLTALLKYERIELNYNRADETRGYVELLISQALRYGPCHMYAVDLANFWILEKQLIHKLFYVLIPRYQNYTTTYTSIYTSPRIYPGVYWKRAVLELKGNPFPCVKSSASDGRLLMQNILLHEAKKSLCIKLYENVENNISK